MTVTFYILSSILWADSGQLRNYSVNQKKERILFIASKAYMFVICFRSMLLGGSHGKVWKILRICLKFVNMCIKKFLYKISNIKSAIYCNLDKNHVDIRDIETIEKLLKLNNCYFCKEWNEMNQALYIYIYIYTIKICHFYYIAHDAKKQTIIYKLNYKII